MQPRIAFGGPLGTGFGWKTRKERAIVTGLVEVSPCSVMNTGGCVQGARNAEGPLLC